MTDVVQNQNAAAQLKRFEQQLADLIARKKERGDQIEAQYGVNSPRYQRAQERYEKAKDRLAATEIRIDRPLKKRNVAPWLYAATACALAALETPVNKFIFDVVLHSFELVSWAVAFVVGLMLFGLSHVIGSTLRQVWSEYHRRLNWKNLLWFAASSLFVLSFVSALAVARWRYSLVGDASDLGSLVGDLGSQLQSIGGAFQILRTALGDPASQTLAGVNLSAVVVAVFLSYTTHDPDEEFHAAAYNLQQCDERLTKIGEVHSKKLARLTDRFEPKITQLNDYAAVAKERAGGASTA